jgi:hypothetical protein
LAGVGGLRVPTIARGKIRSLLEYLELADNARHMTTRRAHPAVSFFGTLISRSFSFVCLFHQSVHFYRFTFEFSFAVSFLSFFFVVTVPAIRGSWNNTHWPLNLGLRWLHASRLSSCGLSFYRSLFSSFSFPFPSILLFFFTTSVTVRQSQFRFPFIPVTCRNVIFFSSFPQPSSFCSCVSNL